MTLRKALAHSLNVATVKVAEMVGFDRVADLWNRKLGMSAKVQPRRVQATYGGGWRSSERAIKSMLFRYTSTRRRPHHGQNWMCSSEMSVIGRG